MQVPTLMVEGLTLMVYGMSFVFVFLTLLVFSTKLMSVVSLKLVPLDDVVPATARAPLSHAHQIANDARLMAVLAAAVHQYRQDKSA
jgi:oxaloacetate decarboxylase gamma subunit